MYECGHSYLCGLDIIHFKHTISVFNDLCRPLESGAALSLTMCMLAPDMCRALQVFGCDMRKEYPATLFRFPLRTPAQAAESRISKQVHMRGQIPGSATLKLLRKSMMASCLTPCTRA